MDTAKVVAAWERLGRNVSATSRETGLSRSGVYHHLQKAEAGGTEPEKPVADGKLAAHAPPQQELPASGVRTILLTSAQNNTHIHARLWRNLLAYARHLNAELMVGTFTYNKNAYGSLAVKEGTAERQDDLWYDPELRPFILDQMIEVAPGLVWCGNINILPTAVNPLSGFETYTGRKSGIFPAAKFAMESIASAKYDATKFNYTTGTVTQLNYIQKTAGQKAEHAHSYGALIVEITSEGEWFVRQLSADEQGDFQDLTTVVRNGKVRTGARVEAITFGDIHTESLDEDVATILWAPGGMVDALKPRFQFFHDVLDFRRRNHHDRLDPHKRFELWLKGTESVEHEVADVGRFLANTARPWARTVVVNSNHDNALLRWLKETDWRSDPANALFYLEAQAAVLRSIQSGDAEFHPVEWAVRRSHPDLAAIFLREDESFVICGAIECGMHGHLGPNGSGGNPRALRRLGRKANTGHTHSAGIYDGLYVAGTSSKLDLGYNRGPSSWSHSHVVTYPNGRRAIVTLWAGKWRGA